MSDTEITTKKPTTLKGLLTQENIKQQFALAMPKHLDPERFARIAITALTRTPKLQECTQESFFRCLLDLSAMGIEPDGRRAYLIPYGKECTLIVSYMGLIELVRRSGDVTSIRAEIVCENDGFSWENGNVTHTVDWLADRGAMKAVYAEAKLASGETQTCVMTKGEVDGIRSRSKAGQSGPWVSDFNEMAKKTAVRRLTKMLPLSSEIVSHIDRDDDRLPPRNVTPAIKSAPENFFASVPAIETTSAVEEELN